MTCFKDKKFYHYYDIATKNDDLSYSTYWGWGIPQIEPPDTYINCKIISIDFSKIRTRHRFPAPIIFRECTFYYCTFDDVDYCTFDHCTFKDCTFYSCYTCKASIKQCHFENGAPYVPTVCPSEGTFVGWKICTNGEIFNPVLVKLIIPEDAERTSGYGERKCRCSKAYVEGMYNLNGTPSEATSAIARYTDMVYEVGKWVEPDFYDSDREQVCTHGIHFFMERQEAKNFYFAG